MSIAPVWFISHGAPDLVLRDQPATHFLKSLSLGDLKGLVVISAHWFSRTELQINVEPMPEQAAFLSLVRRFGGVAFVARDCRDVLRTLDG